MLNTVMLPNVFVETVTGSEILVLLDFMKKYANHTSQCIELHFLYILFMNKKKNRIYFF